jgi:hypothetical protein
MITLTAYPCLCGVVIEGIESTTIVLSIYDLRVKLEKDIRAYGATSRTAEPNKQRNVYSSKHSTTKKEGPMYREHTARFFLTF